MGLLSNQEQLLRNPSSLLEFAFMNIRQIFIVSLKTCKIESSRMIYERSKSPKCAQSAVKTSKKVKSPKCAQSAVKTSG